MDVVLMSLFTRLLMSLYPQQLLNQAGNPASLFLGMISPQSFFNIVSKKMAENYKINQFDLALDPFEVKIGFGDQSMIKPKSLQTYYSYCVAANLNGHKIYSVSSIATSAVMIASYYISSHVRGHDRYGYYFSIGLYMTYYMLASRLRIFPHTSINDDYQWFMDVWFSCTVQLLQQSDNELLLEGPIFDQIKQDLLAQVELGFTLTRLGHTVSQLLHYYSHDSFVYWLFGHQPFKQITMTYEEIYSHIGRHQTHSVITESDYRLVMALIPHEISLNYLFTKEDYASVVEYIITPMFDWDYLSQLLFSIVHQEEYVREFIAYTTNYQHCKQRFFNGVREFIMNEVRDEEIDHDELEELISSIEGKGISSLPESLRKESSITERLMNFYLNYVGGHWNARGDTFEFMLNSQVADWIRSLYCIEQPNTYELDLYNHYLDQYVTNAGYYYHIYQGVRSGKASFTLPYVIQEKDHSYPVIITPVIVQSSIVTLLQDLLYKDIKLYPKSQKLLALFRDGYGDRVTHYLSSSPQELYHYIVPLVESDSYERFPATIIASLRDSLYTIDVHCYHDVVTRLCSHELYRTKYGKNASFLLAATLRETLYGLLCFMAMIQKQSKYSDAKKREFIQFILTTYVVHIVGLQDTATMILCFDTIFDVYQSCEQLLIEVIELDDNQEFIMMGVEFVHRFLKDKDDILNAHTMLLSEDKIWLRGYIKHIHYYNKRYFIPQT